MFEPCNCGIAFVPTGGGAFSGLADWTTAAHLAPSEPRPIIPRRLIREVSDQVDWKGPAVLELNRGEAAGPLEELLEAQVEAIAISLLWSFVNPAHELEVKRMVQERAPAMFVTCAHELIARMGEYE